MIRRSGFLLFFFWSSLFAQLFLASSFAAEAPTQIAAHVSDEILVRFRDGVEESKKDLTRFRIFGKQKKVFAIVPELEVIKLPPGVSVQEALAASRQDPDVLYAEPNYILYLTAKPELTATPNDPSFGSLWGLSKINAPGAWNTTTGSNSVVVGILDTGIDYNHQDLKANVLNPAGTDVWNHDSDPMDDNGHGTHVAGTIGAVGNNGIGVVGVNWTVGLMSCKFFDADGNGTTDGAIECLEYFKAKKDSGVNIVATSNSWGGGDFSQALYDAIDAQRASGILFITAAGNGNIFGVGLNNDTIPFYPCTYYLPNIICVAATTSTDAKASFSNYGRRTVHLGAPGYNILSTLPGNTYGSSNGTSMATPHVSGVAALLKAQVPSRDWRAIKNLILTGGNTISSMSNTITGKRLNANGSMTCSNTVVQSRMRPIASTISASPGVPVNLGYLNIKCASPNGNVNVTVSPGNQTITLLDGGVGSDQAAGDGIYSGQWTPSAAGTYTLTFPGNDKVTVNVANPTISISPTSQSFGNVGVGSSADKNFTVTNSGGGILTGNASTNSPFSIVSGGSYNLSAGQSQTVVVRFTPTSASTFSANVTFTGGGDASALVSGTGVIPASITLTFDGKLRDRVGRGDTALTPDGALDGTLTVTLQAGSGNRTVTKLELRRSDNSGIWNTTADSYWALGAAGSLDGPLYNNTSNASVNFAVSDGGSFEIFAADFNGTSFPPGATLLLTANFADGSTATASAIIPSPPPPPPAPSMTLTFDGKLRDRVGGGDTALTPDGALDGTLTVTLQAGSGNRTVTKLELRRSDNSGIWNTTADSYWALGAAGSLDGPLYNNTSNASVNFAVSDGGSFEIFAADFNGTSFPPGATLLLTANFADGSTATASTTIPPPPPPPLLTLTYNGKLRDRVGRGDTAVSGDGSLDATFTVSVQPGSGNRTVTKLELRRSDNGGIWNTTSDMYWVLGAAGSLDGPLYNAANASVNFAVSDNTSFYLFAPDDGGGGTYFPAGSTFTVTANFADGSTATASTTMP